MNEMGTPIGFFAVILFLPISLLISIASLNITKSRLKKENSSKIGKMYLQILSSKAVAMGLLVLIVPIKLFWELFSHSHPYFLMLVLPGIPIFFFGDSIGLGIVSIVKPKSIGWHIAIVVTSLIWMYWTIAVFSAIVWP